MNAITKLVVLPSVAAGMLFTAQATIYSWPGGSGDFTDWGSSTITTSDDIRIWTSDDNAPWIDGTPGAGVATNFACKSIDIRNPLNYTSCNTLVVRNGGLLEASSVSLMSALGQSSVTGSSTGLQLLEGSRATLGTLDFGGYRQASVNGFLDLLGGSQLHVTGQAKFALSTHNNGGTCFDFYVRARASDSTFIAGNGIQFGNSYEDAVNYPCLYDLRLDMTNTTIVCGNNFSAYHAQAYFKDCSLVFTNKSSVSSGTWQNGALLSIGRGSNFTFDGGSISNAYLCVGNATAYGSDGRAWCSFENGRYDLTVLSAGTVVSDGAGYIMVRDGADVTYPAAADSFYLGRNGGTGVVEVTGGTLRVRENSGTYQCQVASRSNGGYGRVTVSGGLWDHTASCIDPLLVGAVGEGRIEVTGGEVRAAGFVVGGSAYASEFFQGGGLVTLCGTGKSSNTLAFSGAANGSATCRLTGGTLAAQQIFCKGGTTSYFIADGGTVKPVATLTGTTYFIADFASAICGASGLTVDTDGFDVTATQSFTDASGVRGVFRKTGLGTYTSSAASWSVSRTVVDGGAFVLGNAASTFATALIVTNGASFSFGDVPTIALSGLVVSNATLKINPAVNRITVNGPVAFDRLRIAFTTVPTTDQMNTVLTIVGGADEATAQAWRRAIIDNDISEGTHGASVTSDDRTTFSIGIKTDVPLTDATVWQGADGAWGESGNWSADVPTASKLATFGASGVKSIALGATATAGALSFEADGFVLSGDTALSVPSEEGSAKLSVTVGSQKLDAPLTTDVPIAYAVAAESSLTLAKRTEGGVIKTGMGALRLEADNAFFRPVTLKEGVLDIATAAPFGTDCGEVRQYRGCLVATNASAAATLPQTLSTRATSGSYTIVNNDADLSFAKWEPVSGSLIKRGEGRLSLTVADGVVANGLSGTLAKAPSNWWIIPEGDELPYEDKDPKVYMTPQALTVLEGELELRGGKASSLTVDGSAMIGACTKYGVAEPQLTVRNLDLYFNNNFYMGVGASGNTPWDTFYRRPTLTVVDGSVRADYLNVGTFCYGKDAYPTLNLTNATLKGYNQIQLSQGNYGKVGAAAIYRAKDSRLCYERNDGKNEGSLTWFAGLDADFDNCFLGRSDGAAGIFGGFSKWALGQAVFRNGTVFAFRQFTATSLEHDVKLIFDDATWRTDDNDLSLTESNVTKGYLSVEVRGTGLRLPVTADHTFTFGDVPVTGTGGLVKSGAGTVAFADGMYQFTGTLVAEAGVIDLTNAGTITNATLAAGAGTIKGGTFHNATLRLDPFDSSTFQPFNFTDCTFTGVTRVEVGGEPVRAKGITVVNYTGTLTGVNTFRLKGWKGFGGNFTASDGQVTVDVGSKGQMLIIR